MTETIRQLARHQECTLRLPGICNYNPETTVLAHLACGTRGMGIKGIDSIACFACSSCHAAIDLLVTSGEIPVMDVLRSIAETHQIAIREGSMVLK